MIAKADIRRVQEWMGHADVATTMKYLHYVERPDEAELVAAAFAGRGPTASHRPRLDAVRDDPGRKVRAHEEDPAPDPHVRQAAVAGELVDSGARNAENSAASSAVSNGSDSSGSSSSRGDAVVLKERHRSAQRPISRPAPRAVEHALWLLEPRARCGPATRLDARSRAALRAAFMLSRRAATRPAARSSASRASWSLVVPPGAPSQRLGDALQLCVPPRGGIAFGTGGVDLCVARRSSPTSRLPRPVSLARSEPPIARRGREPLSRPAPAGSAGAYSSRSRRAPRSA